MSSSVPHAIPCVVCVPAPIPQLQVNSSLKSWNLSHSGTKTWLDFSLLSFEQSKQKHGVSTHQQSSVDDSAFASWQAWMVTPRTNLTWLPQPFLRNTFQIGTMMDSGQCRAFVGYMHLCLILGGERGKIILYDGVVMKINELLSYVVVFSI